ncbi:hypothetical protein VKT23_020185 [Stygiomarasmius scandens]|uniref:Uncharacterized protein n=1 Tax=Marasmiellus scandens TaxID=2682957 RepID=A0ABR1IJH6_9AGAR
MRYEEQVGEETVVGAEEEDVIRAAYKKSREWERYTRSRSPEVVPPPKWVMDKEREREDLKTPLPASPGRPRKRSCDEVDDAKRGASEERRSPGTPPKRIRRESPLPLTRAAKGVASLLPTSPSRKRSSEELEDEVADGDADAAYVLEQRKDLVDGGGGSPERRFKRFKTHSEEEDGDVVSPPRSLTGESTGERWESVSSEEQGAVGVRILKKSNGEPEFLARMNKEVFSRSAEATPRPKALVPSAISFPPPSPTSSHSASSSYTPHPDHRELHIPTPIPESISTSISNTAGASLASSIPTELTSAVDTGPTMNNGSTRPTFASTPMPAAPPSSYEIYIYITFRMPDLFL